MIVGSASYISDDPHPPLHEIYRNNESVSPNPRNPLENYTLYSVDMVDGVLCDTIKFKTDKIFLSHNQVKTLADFTKTVRYRIQYWSTEFLCLKIFLLMSQHSKNIEIPTLVFYWLFDNLFLFIRESTSTKTSWPSCLFNTRPSTFTGMQKKVFFYEIKVTCNSEQFSVSSKNDSQNNSV